MKLLKRFLVLPFVIAITVIAKVFECIRRIYLFARYGGEVAVYDKKTNAKTIKDVYELMLKSNKQCQH